MLTGRAKAYSSSCPQAVPIAVLTGPGVEFSPNSPKPPELLVA